MASKAVNSAVAVALGALLLVLSAPDGGTANASEKTSPERAPDFFKVFSKDGSESLTADCSAEDIYPEGRIPAQITCKFLHVRFQPPSSENHYEKLESFFLAPTIEEAVKVYPITAEEFQKHPQKARNDWEKAKRDFREMHCSASFHKNIQSEIAKLPQDSRLKQYNVTQMNALINACSTGDSLATIFRVLKERSRTCELWVDHFGLDFRRIDRGKWFFTQNRPGLSGTLKIYELTSNSKDLYSWTLTETKMTMGQKDNAGSNPVAEQKVWSWESQDYVIPDDCLAISHRLVQSP